MPPRTPAASSTSRQRSWRRRPSRGCRRSSPRPDGPPSRRPRMPTGFARRSWSVRRRRSTESWPPPAASSTRRATARRRPSAAWRRPSRTRTPSSSASASFASRRWRGVSARSTIWPAASRSAPEPRTATGRRGREAKRRRRSSPPRPRPTSTSAGKAEPDAEGRLSIATVTLDELRALGMSGVQAKRVIDYREHAEGFESLDQLDRMPGFSEALLAHLKDRLTL